MEIIQESSMTYIFKLPRNIVFQAAEKAIEENPKMKIKQVNKDTYVIEASFGISFYSWGEYINIQLREIEESICDVQITVSAKLGKINAPHNLKVIEKLKNGISDILKKR